MKKFLELTLTHLLGNLNRVAIIVEHLNAPFSY